MADFKSLVAMIEQIKASQERMEALMVASLEMTEACLEKI
jgi:hypothetical protein